MFTKFYCFTPLFSRSLYNSIHRGIVEQKGKRANDLNSLLKKDKLTLLGVQLQVGPIIIYFKSYIFYNFNIQPVTLVLTHFPLSQEQESKLFAKHKENSFHLSKTTNNEFNIRQLPQNFDPNKFKAVNETSVSPHSSTSDPVSFTSE